VSDAQGGFDDLAMCVWCQRLIDRAYMTRHPECCAGCSAIVQAVNLLLSKTPVQAILRPEAAQIRKVKHVG
jgi:hypothetical protein